MGLAKRTWRLLAVLAAGAGLGGAAPPQDLVASWRLGDEPVTLRSRPQDAGAISSLVFRGRQFIASRENGWLLQGAGTYGLWAECLNPTQAGARYDPPGTTSSRLLEARADTRSYQTRTRMAFWTPPGRRCSDAQGARRHAANTTVLSDTYYAQTLTPGFRDIAAAIDDQVVITTPRSAPIASFEVLTGYMPPDFDRFYSYQADTRRLQPLADGDLTTERFSPEVVSTADGRLAMGVVAISPLANAHYAALRNGEVGKWSLVYHYTDGLAAGPHSFECVILLGTRAQVLRGMQEVQEALERPRRFGAVLIALAAASVALGSAWFLSLRARGPLRPLS